MATQIDLEDVLVLESEWSTYYGQTLLTVEHDAGGASGKQYTQYLFVDDLMYTVSLFPLETYDTSSETYDRNTTAVYDVDRVLFRLRPYILEPESVQRQLAENCARDISQRSDGSSFDPENKTVTIWVWDEEIQDSIALIFCWMLGFSTNISSAHQKYTTVEHNNTFWRFSTVDVFYLLFLVVYLSK